MKRINLFDNSRKWHEKELDKVCALIVKRRDDWTCKRCRTPYAVGSKGLQCSHFFSRIHRGTRWDLDNLDALCAGCHFQVEHDKQGWYREYMIKKLGQNGYNVLEMKALSITKFTTADLKLLLLDFENKFSEGVNV